MEERRRFHRAVPMTDVNVLIGGIRHARMLDISPIGAGIELPMALSPRAECPLSIPLLDGTVRLQGRITRCRLTSVRSAGPNDDKVYRAGVEFVGIDPKMAAAIASSYPPEEVGSHRAGPIKIRVNVDELERRMRDVN